MALFNNLAHVRIATSKTILDLQYNKLGTRVASLVTERPKLTPPSIQPQSKMQQTQDTPQQQDDIPMTPKKKATDDKANDSDNCNDDDFDLNNPKTFDESSEEHDPAPDKQQTRWYNQTVTVVLPTTEQIISLQKLNDQPIGELPVTERCDVKSKFAKAVMGSSLSRSLLAQTKRTSTKSKMEYVS